MLKAIVYNPVTGQIVDGVDVPGIKQVRNTKEPPQSYLDQLAASFQVCHAQHGSQTRQQPLQQPLRRSPRVVQSAQTNTTTGGHLPPVNNPNNNRLNANGLMTPMATLMPKTSKK